MRKWVLAPALRIAIVYALVGGLWILYSDRLVFAIAPDNEIAQRLEIFKGWFYVAFHRRIALPGAASRVQATL
jgi:hypothetical protein